MLLWEGIFLRSLTGIVVNYMIYRFQKLRKALPLFTVVYCCIFFLSLAFFSTALAKVNKAENASHLDFSFFKKGDEGPVLLVIGGIQGDEPGGFSAATLIATRYSVKKGSLWVVPNLNFPSIIKSSRGIHGDMNRKFAALDSKDPQYNIVSRIQEIIRDPRVCLVLNLHDGSGYYRPTYIDKWHGPKRWGQSVIIDQARMPKMQVPQGNALVDAQEDLAKTAAFVSAEVNKHLLEAGHIMHVHDTQTAKGDKEMEKSLSWFAVRHGKPAFGLEASKNLPVVKRTYYHLHMIESFAKNLGIELHRDFDLHLDGVRKALYSDLSVSFMGGRIILPLEDVRRTIRFLPLQPLKEQALVTSKPIMAVLPKNKDLQVHYGNRLLTTINPDWHELDTSLTGVKVKIDGTEREVAFGESVQVQKRFTVLAHKGYRVNAIGANTGLKDENLQEFTAKSFIKTFSVDNGGSIYRVEVYKDKKFCGMFLVRFAK